MRAGSASLWACALFGALAANATAAQGPAPARFALHGTGSLAGPPLPQASGRYAVNVVAEPLSPSPALPAERFVIVAVASANSLVCYNDTLFRDSFDGNGL